MAIKGCNGCFSDASTACSRLDAVPARARRWADVADTLDSDDDCPSHAGLSSTCASVDMTTSWASNGGDHCEGHLLKKECVGLNANAIEFIPTLTMACPLVGFCTEVPEQAAAQSPQFTAAPLDDTLHLDNTIYVADGTYSDSCAFPAQEVCRHNAGRRRRPSRLAHPHATVREDFPNTSEKPSSFLITQPAKGQMLMPEATEEEWQHRIELREKSVTVVKATPEYRWFAEARAQNKGVDAEPHTPDPRDRTVSKRHFKYLVQQWRCALYQLHFDGRGSVASAEDVKSVATATTETGGAATFDGDDESCL